VINLHRAVLMLALVAACGDDDDQPPPKPGQPGAPGGPAAQAKDDKTKLQPRLHVEDRVSCPLPEKPDGPECKPDSPTCEIGKYCLQFTQNQYFCEACPERDSIRHEFRDRDFVAQQARDPFQSFVIIVAGLGEEGSAPQAPTVHCTRDEQFVASSYSYSDLRLVGIVAQGTQRKVLMMGGNLGYIIKRGDCVGKEKALVKDIGTGYLTFALEADQATKRPAEERSIQLHPSTVNMDQQRDDTNQVPQTPIVAPPAPKTIVAPPGPAPAPGPVAPPKTK
jgi:Tfp pilus assembly protein PilP